MHRRRWRLGALTGSVALALGAAACGGSGSASNAPPAGAPHGTQITIDYANFSDASSFLKDFGEGFVNAAKVAGYKLKYYNNNLDGPTAIAQAHLMVQDHPDIILEANAVAGVGKAIGNIFTAAKIPCIAINVPVPGCPLLNQVNKAVGIEAAQAMAPIAKAAGDTGKNTTVIIVQDAAAGTEVNDCVRYFYTTLEKLLPGLSQVTPSQITATTTKIGTTGVSVDGSDTLQDAFTAVRNVLPTIPAKNHLIVMGVADPGAEGALRAIQDAGRAGSLLLSGQGGGADGVHFLRTVKQWVIEPSVFNTTWSELAMAMVAAHFKGIKLPALTTVLQSVMTKQNVNQYYTSTGTVYHLPALDTAPPPGNLYLGNFGILQKFHNVTGL